MSDVKTLKPEEAQSSTIVVEPEEAEAAPEEAQSSTIVVKPEEAEAAALPPVRLKLKKPKSKKKVAWSSDTVDNENMNKKKSKCCCIYEKPKDFGESSSESDDECEHCKGHVERKRAKAQHSSTEENHLNPIEDQNK